ASTVAVPTFGKAVKAGVGVIDATWHVGASAGQYATDRFNPTDPTSSFLIGDHGQDPDITSILKVPSYGIQSRDDVRALVVEGVNGHRMAFVKDDLYIPQDLLDQRVA